MKKMTIRKMLERIVVATNKRRAKNMVSFSYTKTAAPVRRPGGTAKRVEVTVNTAEKKGAITHDH